MHKDCQSNLLASLTQPSCIADTTVLEDYRVSVKSAGLASPCQAMLLLQTRSNTHICRSTHRTGPATSNHVVIADCNSPPGLSMKLTRRLRRLELYCQCNGVQCPSFKPTGPHHLEFHCQCNSAQCCRSSFESLAISDCITNAVVIKDYRSDSSGLTVSSCVAVVLVLSDYSLPSTNQGCKASPLKRPCLRGNSVITWNYVPNLIRRAVPAARRLPILNPISPTPITNSIPKTHRNHVQLHRPQHLPHRVHKSSRTLLEPRWRQQSGRHQSRIKVSLPMRPCSIHQRRSIEMSCTNDTESPTRSTKNTEPSSHWAIVYLGIGKSNKEEYHILNRATGTYLTTTCKPSKPLETQTTSTHMLKQIHSGRQRPRRRHLQPEEPSGERRALEHRPRVQQARTVRTVLVSPGTQKLFLPTKTSGEGRAEEAGSASFEPFH